jgi:penicillin-binding protein 2
MSLSIKDCRQEKGDFFNRILFMVAVVACAALVLLGRAYKLQVIDHEQFSTLSADNRLRLTPIPPIRGLVYDRSGRLLAGNQPSFSLEMIPEKVADIDATLNAIAAVSRPG